MAMLRRRDLWLVVALFLLAGLAEYRESFSLLEDQTLTARHILRMRYGAPEENRFGQGITLIKTDETFFDAYGGYPMRRRDIGTLIGNLKKLGARVVVVDYLIDYPSAYGEDDALAESLKPLDDIFLASRIIFKDKKIAGMGYPIEKVRDRSRSGYVNLRSQSALVSMLSRVRIYPEVTSLKDGWPIAVQALAAARGATPHLSKEGLLFRATSSDQKDFRVPLDHFSDLHLQFPALPDGIGHLHEIIGIGALDFLELDQLDEEDIRELKQWVNDRIVIIGDLSEISHDKINTPVGVLFGAEVIAITLDTLMKGGPLAPASSPMEWLIAALLAIGLIFTATVRHPAGRNLSALALLLAYLGTTTLFFIHAGVIFSQSYWIVATLLGLIGINLYYYGLERRRRAQVKEEMAKLVDVGISLSSEAKFIKLLEEILEGACSIAQAQGGTLYLVHEEKQLEYTVVRNSVLNIRHTGQYGQSGQSGEQVNDNSPFPPLPLFDEQNNPRRDRIALRAFWGRETIHIPDIYASDVHGEPLPDLEGIKAFDQSNKYHTESILTVPMKTLSGEVVGLFQLITPVDRASGRVVPFTPEIITVVEAFASQAAVALDNQILAQAQKDLLDAFIQVIAGAIDAKSPYTGGHCQRVPELAVMLAEAARESNDAPFADYTPDEGALYELSISAWLHDCGKVTTPEYVVDKATKLETIYNRIHEIRMRFEALWRDAEIDYWQGRTAFREGALGALDPETLLARKEQKQKKLQEEFAFIAECNEGGEFMADERIERLKSIAGRTWQRHFDDRIGLSQEESLRKEGIPAPESLPVEERLLEDRPDHIIARHAGSSYGDDNPHGFTMKVPEHLFNLGEIYNLSVKRGTLTEEDRFKINEHAVQTIQMLNHLPFPKHLKGVPEIAGGHHETLNGRGYPKGLKGDDLPIQARIMALADIFEALTASDRPYKKPKTVSQAIRIMGFMVKDAHLDADLFKLFLTSGIHQRYAEIFLKPEQLDEVDITAYD